MSQSKDDTSHSVFHEGQVKMQELANTRAYAARMESVLHFATKIDAGILDILENASIIYVAYYTSDGNTWITPLIKVVHDGEDNESLIQVITARQVRIVASMVMLNDPILKALDTKGALVGFTVMQEWTRDRIRVNGRITKEIHPDAKSSSISFEMKTTLSLGLCPKYIVDRRIQSHRTIEPSMIISSESRSLSAPIELPSAAIDLIRETDTFWLGTTEINWGSQSSHRGGFPGFVRIIEQQPPSLLPRLVWADYAGNNFFHSLGSALSNPTAAITILHYQLGHILQMTGILTIITADQPGIDFDGANRHCQFDVQQWRLTMNAIPYVFKMVSRSIANPILRPPRTSGDHLLEPSESESTNNHYTEMTLVDILQSSNGVKIFRLAPTDTKTQLQWLPAQYGTLRLIIDGREHERSWTITSLHSTLSKPQLELTIRRDPAGIVSRYLHDRAAVGQKLHLMGIEGNFSLPSMYWSENTEGITSIKGKSLRRIWLSGGIGITPFIGHMRCLLRFHSIHAKAGIDVPSTDIIWLHVDQAIDHIPYITEIATFVKAANAMQPTQLKVFFVLALTRVNTNGLLAETQDRWNKLFNDQSKAPHTNIIFSRPSASTLLQLPISSTDNSTVASYMNLRSIDACGSAGLTAQFKQWAEEWKTEGLKIIKFRTESFAY